MYFFLWRDADHINQVCFSELKVLAWLLCSWLLCSHSQELIANLHASLGRQKYYDDLTLFLFFLSSTFHSFPQICQGQGQLLKKYLYFQFTNIIPWSIFWSHYSPIKENQLKVLCNWLYFLMVLFVNPLSPSVVIPKIYYKYTTMETKRHLIHPSDMPKRWGACQLTADFSPKFRFENEIFISIVEPDFTSESSKLE